MPVNEQRFLRPDLDRFAKVKGIESTLTHLFLNGTELPITETSSHHFTNEIETARRLNNLAFPSPFEVSIRHRPK